MIQDYPSWAQFEPELQLYVIPGKPVPLQRPRYSMAHIYDAQKREKAVAAIHIAHCHGELPPYSGPLQLNVKFYFETPKKNRKLTGTLHTARPDTDNLIKWICDVAQNAGIYRDDSFVTQILAIKLYDIVPRTEFTIKKLK